MGCLFVLFASLFPRLGVLVIWLARPIYFANAFGGSLLAPVLGVIFLPFTTLLYVLMWSPTSGVGGLDWVWLIVAALIDIGGWASSGYANRDRYLRRRID